MEERQSALESLRCIIFEEQQLNRYLYSSMGSIPEVQLDNMLYKMDALHEQKKRLLNFIQSLMYIESNIQA